MALILHPDYLLYERKDKAFCSSLQVAQEFKREHKNVLRDIRELDCLDDFRLLNFELTLQNVAMPNGATRKDPIYLMTKDGFMYLVMGYRGKKASIIKQEYIKRFNAYEAFIREYILNRDDFLPFTQAIMDNHEEPKSYHYSNEYDMINRLVLGMTAKQFKQAHGLEGVHSIRPFLSVEQAKTIRKLQVEDIRLLYRGFDFQDRKLALNSSLLQLKAER